MAHKLPESKAKVIRAKSKLKEGVAHIQFHIENAGDRSVGIQPTHEVVTIIHNETDPERHADLAQYFRKALADFYEEDVVIIHTDDGKCPVCDEKD